MNDQTKFLLNETDLPRYWYNINADSQLPPTPVLRPDTLEPVTPDFLSVLFPMELILQEVSTERFIPIPRKCARSTSSTGPRRFYAPAGSSAPWGRRRTSTTRTSLFHRLAAISRTRRFPRRSITRRRDEGPDDGDGRRAMGFGPGPGLQLLRA